MDVYTGLWTAEERGITRDQKSCYVIHTDVYTATIDSSGALSSLVIEGSEFIAPPTPILTNKVLRPATGLFALPTIGGFHPAGLTGVRAQHDNVINCQGAGWTLDYTFSPDTIDFTYEGAPEGGRGFTSGYPAADLMLSLAHDLDRACDPENQGELGWPVQRKFEPGNYALLAKNGAGFVAENASALRTVGDAGCIPTAPHRLDLLVFDTSEKGTAPLHRRLKLFRKADLAHSVTLKIQSPSRQNLFSGTDNVVFAVQVHSLYGRQLNGTVEWR